MNPLEIPLKENSHKRVTFTDTAVTFGDVSIKYTDVAGVSFGSGKTSTNFTNTASFGICIRSISEQKIEISSHATKISLVPSDPKINYESIIAAVQQFIAPALLMRIISKIFTDGQYIKINSMIFDSDGITSENIFGTRKRAPWSARPEVRGISTNNYLTGATRTGVLEVAYFNAAISKMVVIGKTSSRDENGFLVPHICQLVRQSFE